MFKPHALIALVAAGCGSGGLSFPDANNFAVGGPVNPADTAFVDGDYTWSVLDPPRFGGSIVKILVVSPTDVWLAGDMIRHYDGQTVTAASLPDRQLLFGESLPPEPTPHGVPVDLLPPPDLAGVVNDLAFTSVDFGVPTDAGQTASPDGGASGSVHDLFDSLAAVSATDVWACGTRPMHYDGHTWSDLTAEVPQSVPIALALHVSGYHCEVAAGGGKVWIAQSFGSSVQNPGPRPTTAIFNVSGHTWTRFGTAGFVIPQEHTLLGTSDGKLGMYNFGIFAESGGPGSDLMAMPGGLHNHGLTWGQSGDRVFSYSQLALTDGNELDLVAANIPGDLQRVASLPFSQFPWSPGLVNVGPVGGDSSAISPNEYDVTSVAGTSSGAIYLMRTQDTLGQFAFVALLSDTTAKVPADRLYGWEPFQVAAVGQNPARVRVERRGAPGDQTMRRTMRRTMTRAMTAVLLVGAVGCGSTQTVDVPMASGGYYVGTSRSDIWRVYQFGGAGGVNISNLFHYDGSNWSGVTTPAIGQLDGPLAPGGPGFAYVGTVKGVLRIDGTGAMTPTEITQPNTSVYSDGGVVLAVTFDSPQRTYLLEEGHFQEIAAPPVRIQSPITLRGPNDIWATSSAQQTVDGTLVLDDPSATVHYDGKTWTQGSSDRQVQRGLNFSPRFPPNAVWANCGTMPVFFDGATTHPLGVVLPSHGVDCLFQWTANQRPSMILQSTTERAGTETTAYVAPSGWRRLEWDGASWTNNLSIGNIACSDCALDREGASYVAGELDDGTAVISSSPTAATTSLFLVAP